MAVTLDLMEYANDSAAQTAYVSSDTTPFAFIDQDSEDDNSAIGNVAQGVGQSFTLTTDTLIMGCSIKLLSAIGSPTGNITCKIETNSSGKPSGSLADANASISFTPTTSAWNDETFAIAFILPAGIYWLTGFADTSFEAGNYWQTRRYNSDGYAGGNLALSTDGGSNWTDYSTRDLTFRIWSIPLQCFSEPTIKTQGSYSLKGIAAITGSLNDTLTKSGLSIDLSDLDIIKLDIRAKRTGSHIKIGFHDSGGNTIEHTANILTTNEFQTEVIDISDVSNANKDDIDSIIITILNSDVANTFYFDNMFALDAALLKRYTGAVWEKAVLKRYNGSDWKGQADEQLKYYTGAAWREVYTGG